MSSEGQSKGSRSSRERRKKEDRKHQGRTERKEGRGNQRRDFRQIRGMSEKEGQLVYTNGKTLRDNIEGYWKGSRDAGKKIKGYRKKIRRCERPREKKTPMHAGNRIQSTLERERDGNRSKDKIKGQLQGTTPKGNIEGQPQGTTSRDNLKEQHQGITMGTTVIPGEGEVFFKVNINFYPIKSGAV